MSSTSEHSISTWCSWTGILYIYKELLMYQPSMWCPTTSIISLVLRFPRQVSQTESLCCDKTQHFCQSQIISHWCRTTTTIDTFHSLSQTRKFVQANLSNSHYHKRNTLMSVTQVLLFLVPLCIVWRSSTIVFKEIILLVISSVLHLVV